jgi:DNA (cytosine-5)-methyltransferase 1
MASGKRKPVLLDICCGAGGCSRGYEEGGFDVWGVDNAPIRNYVTPHRFLQGDGNNLLDTLLFGGIVSDAIPGGPGMSLEDIDAIHVSPPCQGYSVTKRFNPGKPYPKLIERFREQLTQTGKPYIIENVEQAPLYTRVTLCGAMFPEDGLRTYRHRKFETNFQVPQPIHPPHLVTLAKMGRPPEDGQFMHVVGNFPSAQYARDAMGIHWMNREELAEAIPPSYTRYIAAYLKDEVI